MENYASIITSIMQEVKLSKSSDENIYDAKAQANYRTLFGELIYLMVQILPDLAYLLSKLAQFMSNPCEKHWTALKSVFRYL